MLKQIIWIVIVIICVVLSQALIASNWECSLLWLWALEAADTAQLYLIPTAQIQFLIQFNFLSIAPHHNRSNLKALYSV